jgi:hypothetical protein
MSWKEKIEKSLAVFECNEIHLSCFLNGSCLMGYHWNEIKSNSNKNNIQMKEVIFKSILNNYGDIQNIQGTDRALANVLFYLGKMGTIHWKDHLPEEIQQCFWNGLKCFLPNFEAQGISNLIYG